MGEFQNFKTIRASLEHPHVSDDAAYLSGIWILNITNSESNRALGLTSSDSANDRILICTRSA